MIAALSVFCDSLAERAQRVAPRFSVGFEGKQNHSPWNGGRCRQVAMEKQSAWAVPRPR